MQHLEWGLNQRLSQHCFLPIVPRWIEGQAKICWFFLEKHLNYWAGVIFHVGFGWLVGLSLHTTLADDHWSSYMLKCNEPWNVATVQFWQFDLGQSPRTNNTQTKYVQLANKFWVRVHVQPVFFNLNV